MKDWSDAFTSQEKPKILINHQNVGERHDQILPNSPQEKTNSTDTLISDLGLPGL
jgi:hypothetical protein